VRDSFNVSCSIFDVIGSNDLALAYEQVESTVDSTKGQSAVDCKEGNRLSTE